MTEVRDEELSALLDGELDIGRAEQVRAAIGADPALTRRFEALARIDAGLRGAAERAAFLPRVSLPAPQLADPADMRWLAAAAVVAGLLAVRLLPKLADVSLLGTGAQVVACAAIAFVVAAMARGSGSPDRGGTMSSA